jgi:dipeptidase E
VGLVDFHFLPHWNRREDRMEDVIRFSKEHNATVYACRDGDGVVICDGRREMMGEVLTISNGSVITAD